MANPEWQGLVTNTAAIYMKGASDETLRDRLFLRRMEMDGRISFDHNGTIRYWNVKYKRNPMRTYSDGASVDYARRDKHKQLNTDWRGYYTTDEFTELERLACRGTAAIVRRYEGTIDENANELRENFNKEFYCDGNAAGSLDRIHGLESFLAAGTCAAGDRIAMPDDSYAGLDTDLGQYGGGWSSGLTTKPNATLATDYPDGTETGHGEYDFNSPKLINVSSTAWGTGEITWEGNCERALRQAVIWLGATGGKDGKATTSIFGRDYFYQFLNRQESKSRIVLPHKASEDLGFPGTPNFEGLALEHDFDCPASTGYLLNTSQHELACLYKQLFFPRGPTFDMRSISHLMHIGFFGNMRWRPKHVAKLYAYA